MRESTIHSLRSSLSNGWGNLPVRRKLTIGLAAAAVLAGIVSVALWASKPDYSVLFSGLSPEDIQAIEDELFTARVSYKHSTDGTSILVPSSEVIRKAACPNHLIFISQNSLHYYFARARTRFTSVRAGTPVAPLTR